MAQSGGIIPFYAHIVHDRCKTASKETLRAYKTVVEDILKDPKYKDAHDLKDALKACDQALSK